MYVPLHNRSAYSFGSALTRPDALAEFGAAHALPAMALTDRDGLYAAVAFQQACEERGIKPIFGTELQLATPTSDARRGGEPSARITLLAQEEQGYANLCRLISLRHLRESRIATSDLAEHAAGLIGLVGDGSGEWTRVADALRPAFEDRLYIELVLSSDEDAPIARRRARWADEHGLPVVATCDSRCSRREQAPLLRALCSIGTLTLLDQPHPDKPRGACPLRPPDEMRRLFARRPDALTNSLRIAERCDFRLDLSQSRFPPFASPDGRNAMEHLRALGVAGCRHRYVEEPPLRNIGGRRPTLEEALARLERELNVIEQVGYAEYFLVFHEIVEHCRREGIATLARGSAADSLLCYALGVSHACPFRFDLPFDRFINPERARFSKMADIDLDLPWDRRDEVIRWVHDRWGHDRVAMIGCPNTFHARAAVVELGKVHGLPAHEVHRLSKWMPHCTAWNLEEAIARSPEARGTIFDAGAERGSRGRSRVDEPYRTILRQAAELEGLPRHWAMHPCGLVVSPQPLTELVPVQRSPKGPLVAQYDMHGVEDLGFVKIDLLGQAGLSVLRDAVEDIRRCGADVDLSRDVDYGDGPTWEMIAGGEARGVHHIESPAMTSLLQQCNCRDIDCLTSVVAIIRPGAANQGKKEAFARRHQGLEPPRFAHPVLQEVLGGTYGLMVFEEHILQVAVEFADMNLGRADVLRRALNKQNLAMVGEMKQEFVAGALRLGRRPEEIEAVWPELEGFCGFMFNKAHSAEYAVEAFQGAWLKRRWPAHYIAAILSNYRGFYASSPTLPQILYVMEALRLGAGFLPPCVNRSRQRFIVERDGVGSRWLIRLPVSHIHGLNEAFVERYRRERESGPFASLEEFWDRCRPSPSEALALLDCGAVDCFAEANEVPPVEAERRFPHRPALFWRLRELLRRAGRDGTTTLWRPCEETTAPPIDLTPPDLRAVARRERELLGFPVSMDPLTLLGEDEQGRGIDWSVYVPVNELHRHRGRAVRLCGLMVADRINATTQGELMKFVTLADRSGFVETILFPQAYQRFGHLTATHPILEARGVVEPFENGLGHWVRVEAVSSPAR